MCEMDAVYGVITNMRERKLKILHGRGDISMTDSFQCEGAGVPCQKPCEMRCQRSSESAAFVSARVRAGDVPVLTA